MKVIKVAKRHFSSWKGRHTEKRCSWVAKVLVVGKMVVVAAQLAERQGSFDLSRPQNICEGEPSLSVNGIKLTGLFSCTLWFRLII
jgi:hypothetical protein